MGWRPMCCLQKVHRLTRTSTHTAPLPALSNMGGMGGILCITISKKKPIYPQKNRSRSSHIKTPTVSQQVCLKIQAYQVAQRRYKPKIYIPSKNHWQIQQSNVTDSVREYMPENRGRSGSVTRAINRKSIYPRKITGRSSSVTSPTASENVCLKIGVDQVA